MGHHIQAESMPGELAKAIEYENDDNVVAYFPQPKPIQVGYLANDGKGHGTGPYHPDFLCFTKIGIVIHEARDESRLYAKTLKQKRCSALLNCCGNANMLPTWNCWVNTILR